MGGYYGPESSQETPDTQTSMFEYADGTVLEFGTRGQSTNDEGTQRIGPGSSVTVMSDAPKPAAAVPDKKG